MDLFIVPTISFRLLYGLLILQHGRRELVWMGVTAHPTAEWIACQLTEAYGWRQAPRYVIRDCDRVYGHAVLSPAAGDGDTRSADCATVTLAKWLCGAAHRIDPPRMS